VVLCKVPWPASFHFLIPTQPWFKVEGFVIPAQRCFFHSIKWCFVLPTQIIPYPTFPSLGAWGCPRMGNGCPTSPCLGLGMSKHGDDGCPTSPSLYIRTSPSKHGDVGIGTWNCRPMGAMTCLGTSVCGIDVSPHVSFTRAYTHHLTSSWPFLFNAAPAPS
jgi:hypothetical protein